MHFLLSYNKYEFPNIYWKEYTQKEKKKPKKNSDTMYSCACWLK